MQFLKALFDFLFECHHRNLSRVFTIRARTYKVCMDCGAELNYSLGTMSLLAGDSVLGKTGSDRSHWTLPAPSNMAIAILVTLVATCALPTAAGGQSAAAIQQKTATVEVPFEFFTLDTKCPAGSYSVSVVGPTQLFIRNQKENVAAQVFTIADPEFPVRGKNSKLVFVERDGKTYLVGIVASQGFERVSGLFGIAASDRDIRKEVLLNDVDGRGSQGRP